MLDSNISSSNDRFNTQNNHRRTEETFDSQKSSDGNSYIPNSQLQARKLLNFNQFKKITHFYQKNELSSNQHHSEKKKINLITKTDDLYNQDTSLSKNGEKETSKQDQLKFKQYDGGEGNQINQDEQNETFLPLISRNQKIFTSNIKQLSQSFNRTSNSQQNTQGLKNKIALNSSIGELTTATSDAKYIKSKPSVHYFKIIKQNNNPTSRNNQDGLINRSTLISNKADSQAGFYKTQALAGISGALNQSQPQILLKGQRVTTTTEDQDKSQSQFKINRLKVGDYDDSADFQRLLNEGEGEVSLLQDNSSIFKVDGGFSNQFATRSLLRNQMQIQKQASSYIKQRNKSQHNAAFQTTNYSFSLKSSNIHDSTRAQNMTKTADHLVGLSKQDYQGQLQPKQMQKYPFTKSLISHQLNEKLQDQEGFNKIMALAMKEDREEALNTRGKHKVEDRLENFEADFRGKVGMMDVALKSYIQETKYEFLVKPSPYHTREQIQKYIDASSKQEEKGKMIFTTKGLTDFDVISIPKITHFTDHQGNYITKTGHKIDDFNINKQGPEEEGKATKGDLSPLSKKLRRNLFENMTSKRVPKGSSKRLSLEQNEKEWLRKEEEAERLMQKEIRKQEFENIIQHKIDEARRHSMIQIEAQLQEQIFLFSQKLQDHLSKEHPDSSMNPGSFTDDALTQLRKTIHSSPVVVRGQVITRQSGRAKKGVKQEQKELDSFARDYQLDEKGNINLEEEKNSCTEPSEHSDKGEEEEDDYRSIFSKSSGHTEQTKIITKQVKEGEPNKSLWNNIQLKNYSKIDEFSRINGNREQAIVEFIKKCESGLQLPFSLLNCVRQNQETNNKPLLLIDFRLTDAATKGLSEAIKILDKQIRLVQLNKIDLTDSNLSLILEGVLQNPNIESLSISGCEFGKYSCQAFIKLMKQQIEGDKLASSNIDQVNNQTLLLKKISIKDCKFKNLELEQLINNFVLHRNNQQAAISDFQLSARGQAAKSIPMGQPTSQLSIAHVAQEGIENYYEVEDLALSGLQIPRLEPIIKLVRYSDCLTSLDLSYNKLKTQDLEHLCSVLCHSLSLQYLNLSFNHLSELALMYLIDYTRFTWTLIDLDLSFTGIDNMQSKLIELSKAAFESQTLSALHLSGIKIDQDTLKEIREILGIGEGSITRRMAQSDDVINTSQKGGRHDGFVQVSERLIFSRIVGHPEVPLSSRWKECEKCWLCSKHVYCLFFQQAEEKRHSPSTMTLPTSCVETQRIQLTKVEDFITLLGTSVEDSFYLTNNWYDNLMSKLKYSQPQVVLDPKNKDFKTLQSGQWYVAAQFIEPKVVHSIEVNGENFRFQVPSRNYPILSSLNCIRDESLRFQNVKEEQSLIDPKIQTKNDQIVQESRPNFPLFKYSTFLPQNTSKNKGHNFLSPDSSPVANKFKMFTMYKLDDQDLISRCFETDFRYSQITSLVENSSQMQRVSEVLQQYYGLLSDMFVYELAQSKHYPFIALQQVEQVCEKFQLLGLLREKNEEKKERSRLAPSSKNENQTLQKLGMSLMSLKIPGLPIANQRLSLTSQGVMREEGEPKKQVTLSIKSTIRELYSKTIKGRQNQSSQFQKAGLLKISGQAGDKNNSLNSINFPLPYGLKESSTSLVQVIKLLQNFKVEKLSRFQFLEMLFRLSLKVGEVQGLQDSYQCIESFIRDRISPQWDMMRLQDQRRLLIQTFEVDTVLKTHNELLKNIQGQVSLKSQVNLELLSKFFTSLFPEKITAQQIQRCFILSKKYVIDEQEELDKYFSLETREFYEFIVRLAPIIICGTSCENNNIFTKSPQSLCDAEIKHEIKEELEIGEEAKISQTRQSCDSSITSVGIGQPLFLVVHRFMLRLEKILGLDLQRDIGF